MTNMRFPCLPVHGKRDRDQRAMEIVRNMELVREASPAVPAQSCEAGQETSTCSACSAVHLSLKGKNNTDCPMLSLIHISEPTRPY